MNKAFGILCLAIIFNIVGSAQGRDKAVDARSTQRSSSQVNDNAKATGPASSLSAATSLQAALQNTLDVRNAKVGDQVILKTTQAIKQNGQVIVPKGSTLIGHVTDVQRLTGNGSFSRLGMTFDSLQGGNLSIPITATLNSIANARSTANANDDLNADVMGSTSTSARTSSGSSSGGGLLGGVTNTVGGVLNTTTQTVGSVANTATNTVSGTTQSIGRTVNGIQISSSASGSAQTMTTLTSQNSNIRLEKGATFDLTVRKSGGN